MPATAGSHITFSTDYSQTNSQLPGNCLIHKNEPYDICIKLMHTVQSETSCPADSPTHKQKVDEASLTLCFTCLHWVSRASRRNPRHFTELVRYFTLSSTRSSMNMSAFLFWWRGQFPFCQDWPIPVLYYVQKISLAPHGHIISVALCAQSLSIELHKESIQK
jgi:hypothetical protein